MASWDNDLKTFPLIRFRIGVSRKKSEQRDGWAIKKLLLTVCATNLYGLEDDWCFVYYSRQLTVREGAETVW